MQAWEQASPECSFVVSGSMPTFRLLLAQTSLSDELQCRSRSQVNPFLSTDFSHVFITAVESKIRTRAIAGFKEKYGGRTISVSQFFWSWDLIQSLKHTRKVKRSISNRILKAMRQRDYWNNKSSKKIQGPIVMTERTGIWVPVVLGESAKSELTKGISEATSKKPC